MMYLKHKEKRLLAARKYHHKNRDILNKKRKERHLRNPTLKRGAPYSKEGYRKNTDKLKSVLMEHYGSKCFCCGENKPLLLTIDHVNSDGKIIHRNSTNNNRIGGATLYRKLIKENFPKGIQIACYNCNIGRHHNNGVCPHHQ